MARGGGKRYAITMRVKKWYWLCYAWFLNVSMVPGGCTGYTKRRRTGWPEHSKTSRTSLGGGE
jgi:hypothetical protein